MKIQKMCMGVVITLILFMGISNKVSALQSNEADQYVWKNINYGNGIKAGSNSFSGNAGTGQVTISCNSGKIVPASKDGMAFHYTAIPASLNFTLRAKVSVDSWTFTNGQEGFGLMATDMLGGSGWNNSYQAIASKMEFRWNAQKQCVTNNENDSSVQNLIGIGVTEKKGVTAANIDRLIAGDTDTIVNEFHSYRYPLEQRYPYKCNLIGNATNQDLIVGNIDDLITEFYLTIQKNNTGYFITYESVDGTYSTTRKFYDRSVLEQLDEENVYVGFFASRSATATFSEISLTTIEPEKDAVAEEVPVEIIPVYNGIFSQKYTGLDEYNFAFYSNCKGMLNIYRDSERIITGAQIEAGMVNYVGSTSLLIGNNAFKFEFTPSKENVLGENQQLETYEPITTYRTVVHKIIPYSEIWVSPDGTGDGNQNSPMSLVEAVRYARPGQTIIMKEGTYQPGATLSIEKGNNGTEENRIVLKADEGAATRPVIDGLRKNSTMIAGADYWYFKGFDVIHSGNGQTGMQIGGNYNICEDIHTYHNGNTGLSIARTSSRYGKAEWPSYNLIKNCTSYGNADAGYEDADGFAAKITCGEGNVFDGCIAHHNADDGWDLFAKVETGSIGVVTIRNSVAYANGYLEDGTVAGNGNGFKMGGESLPAGHIIMNSIAFHNKTGGIVSNSAPDIKVYQCTSVDNRGSNIALYTGSNVSNTDYDTQGVLSFKTQFLTVNDNISGKGTQDKNKIKNSSDYYWSNNKSTNGNDCAMEDWFISVDVSAYLDGVVSVGEIPRKRDGSINMGDLYALTEKAAANVGAVFEEEAPFEKVTGLVMVDELGWCYLVDGEFQENYNGLIANEAGWWCVSEGKVDFAYTGLWYDQNVGWWYVKEGKIDFGYSGFVLYNSTWWCVSEGRVAFEYTGLWYDQNVGWWYVEEGKINFNYSGLIANEAGWWCVSEGRVAFEYTGLWYDQKVGWWYVREGKIDFHANEI